MRTLDVLEVEAVSGGDTFWGKVIKFAADAIGAVVVSKGIEAGIDGLTPSPNDIPRDPPRYDPMGNPY